MTETDGSTKPPQISEMFHKFALAFKTKTIEFFAEDEDQEPEFLLDDSETFTLLDSADEFITNQRVVVIKPDSTHPNKPTPMPKHFYQTLISSLFATISSFEASYLQLQTAHSPFDANCIEAADRAAVSHLKKLSELKICFKDFPKNPNPNLLIGSPFEAQVQENQTLLRTLEMLVNRLQSEIDVKDAEVLVMKQKLKMIEDSNSRLSNRLSSSNSKMNSNSDAFISIRVFDTVLRYACKLTHKFTKILVDLMKKTGWDLDSAANSVRCNVSYAKIGHNRYAFLSYVCLRMFEGFDSEGFGLEEGVGGIEWNSGGIDSRRNNSMGQFIEHGTGDAMELLSKNPKGCFARFCENKYQDLIHLAMESSIFKNLDRNEQLVLNSWRRSAPFYQSFVEMASSVWMLHKLALAFDPSIEIFQVDRGVDFSMVYMESVTGNGVLLPGTTRAKVGFTVIPGFIIGKTVIQSQVYLSANICEE